MSHLDRVWIGLIYVGLDLKKIIPYFLCVFDETSNICLKSMHVQGDTEQGSLKQAHTSGVLPAFKNNRGNMYR